MNAGVEPAKKTIKANKTNLEENFLNNCQKFQEFEKMHSFKLHLITPQQFQTPGKHKQKILEFI